jgi:hypothetical protein
VPAAPVLDRLSAFVLAPLRLEYINSGTPHGVRKRKLLGKNDWRLIFVGKMAANFAGAVFEDNEESLHLASRRIAKNFVVGVKYTLRASPPT